MKKNSQLHNILPQIKSPSYVLEESLLIENLKLLNQVQEQSEAKILCALKGFAFWHSFDHVSQYLSGGCASGLHEAKLAYEEIKKEVHTYSPAFTDEDIDQIADMSNHIVFNSFSQFSRYKDRVKDRCSIGIRVNPEYSASPVESYNPCSLYSRLGVVKSEFKDNLIDGVDGLHFHALCEQDSDALEDVLEHFEKNFGRYLKKMKWINFGGGHHITKDGYDINRLIRIIKSFKKRHDVEVYLEPGEAIGWQTGSLVATVIDILHNGMDIAILDVSAEAHMPDTLAMPYRPDVRDAAQINHYEYNYRLGGNSCLAGDIIGDYSFQLPLKIGQKIIIEDMLHYTTVKNTTFNGIKLPSLSILKVNGDYTVVKQFGFEEYKRRN